MRALLGKEILVVVFSPFITLNISYNSLLICRVSAEKSELIHNRHKIKNTNSDKMRQQSNTANEGIIKNPRRTK